MRAVVYAFVDDSRRPGEARTQGAPKEPNTRGVGLTALTGRGYFTPVTLGHGVSPLCTAHHER